MSAFQQDVGDFSRRTLYITLNILSNIMQYPVFKEQKTKFFVDRKRSD